jgi:hypothetical protein
MTRPFGKFTYKLVLEDGHELANVKSGVEIQKGDEVNFNGNKIMVLSKQENVLVVVKIGCIINVTAV